MTLVVGLVGRTSVFVAADSKVSSKMVDADRPDRKKLFIFDGPALGASAGYGEGVTEHLFPAVHAIQQAGHKASSTVAFLAYWTAQIAEPMYRTGAAISSGLKLPLDQLVTLIAGFTDANEPQIFVQLHHTGKSEIINQGGFTSFGTDTGRIQAITREITAQHLARSRTEIQADEWAMQIAQQATLEFSDSIGFPVDMGILFGPGSGAHAQALGYKPGPYKAEFKISV